MIIGIGDHAWEIEEEDLKEIVKKYRELPRAGVAALKSQLYSTRLEEDPTEEDISDLYVADGDPEEVWPEVVSFVDELD